ncbi:hypothetical protein Dimus_039637 [Dionaea muscipula]
MIISFWNIRGLNKILKQKEIQRRLRDDQMDFLAILETKLCPEKLPAILGSCFQGWSFASNFLYHPAGRILVLWNPQSTCVEVLDTTDQVMHFHLTCRRTGIHFWLSIVYGLYSVADRRPLWHSLLQFWNHTPRPWLVMGDFNCICDPGDRKNGAPILPYELADFLKCRHETGLFDLPFSGNHFTWTNHRTWCKLDRVLATPDWMDIDRNSSVTFQPMGIFSDHSQCIIRLFNHSVMGKRPFKFLNLWCMHEDFEQLVKTRWSMRFHGCPMFSFTRKLKLLKPDFRHLNEMHFAHISKRVSRMKEELAAAYQRLYDDPDNPALQQLVAELKQRSFRLAEAENSFLAQKAKIHYFKNCDRSSAFFHALIRKKACKSHIASVFKTDGTQTASINEVAEEFLVFFQQLLGVQQQASPASWEPITEGRQISEADREILCQPVTDMEIKNALWSIGENKAPGPDGFTSAFYKKPWHIIGTELIMAVRDFFISGQLLREINHSTLVLIPKRPNASRVDEYRPIACCNVLYKIISKILAKRLEGVLGSIIDTAQTAFIRGRFMIENIYLVNELIRRYMRKRISPRCFFKIDLRKAYDSVDWEFLRGMLSALNFPPVFTHWLMTCVSTASYSISINGQIHGFFNGRKGLRQGDPLSPYLFVICLEYLSRHLKLLKNNPLFSYHPLCDRLNITHLTFADDLIILSRAYMNSVMAILNVLQSFSSCSGLTVSTSKTLFYTAGADDGLIANIEAVTGFQRGTFPLHYLGIPLAASRVTYIQFKPFLDKVGSCIGGWLRHTLSYAGRLELIKAVLQGVDCFWLSIFPIPHNVLLAIEKMCRRFLFGANVHNPPASWKLVCMLKYEGGLGLLNLQAWNLALLAIHLWDIHLEKQMLWLRWVHHYYLHGQSIWTWQPTKEASPLMKKLMNIRDSLLLAKGTEPALLDYLSSILRAGRLHTKKLYDLLRPRQPKVSWGTTVWHHFTDPKISFVLWMAVRGRLRTRDNLRGDIPCRLFPLCEDCNETATHLFFLCRRPMMIWK